MIGRPNQSKYLAVSFLTVARRFFAAGCLAGLGLPEAIKSLLSMDEDVNMHTLRVLRRQHTRLFVESMPVHYRERIAVSLPYCSILFLPG